MEYTAVKCGNMPPLPRGWVWSWSTLRDVRWPSALVSWTHNCSYTVTSFFSVAFLLVIEAAYIFCRNWLWSTNLTSLHTDRFHAALPVSDNRILVCGGCSSIGALQDVHIFNTGELVPLTPWYYFCHICVYIKHAMRLFPLRNENVERSAISCARLQASRRT